MEKIASFTIDHTKMIPGIYISRVDSVGAEKVTTFDVRVVKPNAGDYLDNDEIHTIEHLAATWMRNNKTIADKVIYVGPMGCRTGFYIIMAGLWDSESMVSPLYEMFTFISEYTGKIPGVSAVECGNYKEHSLPKARARAEEYLQILGNMTADNMYYPTK